MKKDIQLTKMDNAYREIALKIQPLLMECMDTKGEAYVAYAVRELAVEFAARHMLAVKAIVKDADQADVMNDFMASTLYRLDQLIEEAVRLGLAKWKDE